jgi:hypothetical protein
MRDLHIYFCPGGEGAAFYSQRSDGPYYLWLYAAGSARWRFSRVRLSRPTLRLLCVARWEAIPTALRDRLYEHYLE